MTMEAANDTDASGATDVPGQVGLLNQFLIHASQELSKSLTILTGSTVDDSFTYSSYDGIAISKIDGGGGFDFVKVSTLTNRTWTAGLTGINLINIEALNTVNTQVDNITIKDEVVNSADNNTMVIIADTNDTFKLTAYTDDGVETYNGISYKKYTKDINSGNTTLIVYVTTGVTVNTN